MNKKVVLVNCKSLQNWLTFLMPSKGCVNLQQLTAAPKAHDRPWGSGRCGWAPALLQRAVRCWREASTAGIILSLVVSTSGYLSAGTA